MVPADHPQVAVGDQHGLIHVLQRRLQHGAVARQFLLDPLALVDHVDGGQGRGLALVVEQAGGQQRPERLLGRIAELKFELVHLTVVAQARAQPPALLLHHVEVGGVPADRLLRGQPEQLRRPVVDLKDLRVRRARQHQGHRHGVDQAALGVLRLLPRRDVGEAHQHRVDTLVRNAHRRQVDPELPVVGIAQQHLDALDTAVAVQHGLHLGVFVPAVVFDRGAPPHHAVGMAVADLGERRVDVQHQRVGPAHDGDRERDGVQDELLRFLGRLKVALGLQPVGYVAQEDGPVIAVLVDQMRRGQFDRETRSAGADTPCDTGLAVEQAGERARSAFVGRRFVDGDQVVQPQPDQSARPLVPGREQGLGGRIGADDDAVVAAEGDDGVAGGADDRIGPGNRPLDRFDHRVVAVDHDARTGFTLRELAGRQSSARGHGFPARSADQVRCERRPRRGERGLGRR